MTAEDPAHGSRQYHHRKAGPEIESRNRKLCTGKRGQMLSIGVRLCPLSPRNADGEMPVTDLNWELR